LPRVTELFEARNPSNPAIVSEIDGVVTFGKIKRGNREVGRVAKDGQQLKYLIGLSKHILVQEGDFVRAGTPLSDGTIAPRDILPSKARLPCSPIWSTGYRRYIALRVSQSTTNTSK
jgi:DNA-directed RNA polymerase subunit beta'